MKITVEFEEYIAQTVLAMLYEKDAGLEVRQMGISVMKQSESKSIQIIENYVKQETATVKIAIKDLETAIRKHLEKQSGGPLYKFGSQ